MKLDENVKGYALIAHQSLLTQFTLQPVFVLLHHVDSLRTYQSKRKKGKVLLAGGIFIELCGGN